MQRKRYDAEKLAVAFYSLKKFPESVKYSSIRLVDLSSFRLAFSNEYIRVSDSWSGR